MYRLCRTTAVVTMIATMFQTGFPASASTSASRSTGATIEGAVAVSCDPSRASEVASVQMRPVSGGPAATADVDPSTGEFHGRGLTEGEYEIFAMGADGDPLSPEPKRLLLRGGPTKIVLSMQPPGCGAEDSNRDTAANEGDPAPAKPRKKRRLKDWHLTLIYLGVVVAVVLAVENDEDEASPSEPSPSEP